MWALNHLWKLINKPFKKRSSYETDNKEESSKSLLSKVGNGNEDACKILIENESSSVNDNKKEKQSSPTDDNKNESLKTSKFCPLGIELTFTDKKEKDPLSTDDLKDENEIETVEIPKKLENQIVERDKNETKTVEIPKKSENQIVERDKNETEIVEIPKKPENQIVEREPKFKKPPSLMNIGATCYLNSALQGISSCNVFLEDLYKLHKKYDELEKLSLFHKLIDILNGGKSNKLEISRNSIFRNWNKSGQQDSFELLAYVMNQVYNEIRKYLEEKKIIQKRNMQEWLKESLPMRIIIEYEIRCVCENKVQVPLQSDLALHVAIPSNNRSDLQRLVEQFFNEDDIEDYECDNQNCTGKGAKRYTRLLQPLPRTLCIHLQRTFWNGWQMRKIDNYIEFPEKLQIKSKFTVSYDNKIENEVVNQTNEFGSGSLNQSEKYNDDRLQKTTKNEDNLADTHDIQSETLNNPHENCTNDLLKEFEEHNNSNTSNKIEKKNKLDNIQFVSNRRECTNDNDSTDLLGDHSASEIKSEESAENIFNTEMNTKKNDNNNISNEIEKTNTKVDIIEFVSNRRECTNDNDSMDLLGDLSASEIKSEESAENIFNTEMKTQKNDNNNISNEIEKTNTKVDIIEFVSLRLECTNDNDSMDLLEDHSATEIILDESPENIFNTEMNAKKNDNNNISNEIEKTNTKVDIIEFVSHRRECTKDNVSMDLLGNHASTEIISEKSTDNNIMNTQKNDNNNISNQSEESYTKLSSLYESKSDYDENLNLVNTSNNENFYLTSVIVHYGSVYGGHYVCYKKMNGEWFLTDDSSIRQVTLDDVLSCKAYILFYEKQ